MDPLSFEPPEETIRLGEHVLAHCRESFPDDRWEALSKNTPLRIGRLAQLSPLYRRLVEQNPEYLIWLEHSQNRKEDFRFKALQDEWESVKKDNRISDQADNNFLTSLRQFRRKISLRIAYRDINEIVPPKISVEELSRMAEFCLNECYLLATSQWTTRYGEPWDEALDQPARFCALALGKLGGCELNFSSDIDLIYLYEGEGHCRKDGKEKSFSNAEYFAKIAESITAFLNKKDENGFLFRADLRLRPGGSHGPIAPTYAAVENYYAATGQTWERLALLKARPVAGEISLGGELLENLQSFRYPRHPPASLVAEVASMKNRTEREVIGLDALERNVKSGFGGIREIEFIVQTLQLLHAGRFPFLQTHSTIEGLHQLVKYELLDNEDAIFLESAYWFLRRIEHCIQMKEEQQSHELPSDNDQRGVIAQTLNYQNLDLFDTDLKAKRERVRTIYSNLFESEDEVSEFDQWWAFFAEDFSSPSIEKHMTLWFGSNANTSTPLQAFIRGSLNHPLKQEQVHRFVALTKSFDTILPLLANPLITLQKISSFGEHYGSRTEFLSACTMNPEFFRVLALLFDRSLFIYQTLCQHPEIMEEVLRPEILRKKKDLPTILKELDAYTEEENLSKWLWLYIRAEQIRIAIGHLIGVLSIEDIESNLSLLADAVITNLLLRFDPEESLAVIALGKFGGNELTFGSDLDILFLTTSDGSLHANRKIQKIQQTLAAKNTDGSIYEIDLRLRPHGDAGPLATTPHAAQKYYESSAQGWERQMLTRARIITGPQALTSRWSQLQTDLLYRTPLSPPQGAELWKMRLRIEKERDIVSPPQRAFKTGAGGIIDFEFLVQILQLTHGSTHGDIRTTGTRKTLESLVNKGFIPLETGTTLATNYDFLKQIEVHLRRYENKGISVISDTPEIQSALPKWMGFPGWNEFWQEHTLKMQANRTICENLLSDSISLTKLENNR